MLAAGSGSSDVLVAPQRGAFAGSVGVVIGLAAWAAALGGLESAVYAGAVALAVAPLVLTGRMYTFYPAMNAVLVLGSAATAWAVVRTSNGALWVAAAAAGLALCVDVRGVLWASPWLLGLTVVALREKIRARVILAVVVLVAVSWLLGAWAFPDHALSLEQQLDVRPLVAYRAGGEESRAALSYPSRFVWGHVAPWELLRTVGFLARNQSAADEALQGLEDFASIRRTQLVPWLWVLGPALVASVAAWWRRWRVLTDLGVTAAPFLLALHTASTSVELQLRFLSQALVVVPLVVGLALAGLLRWVPRRRGLVGGVVGIGLWVAIFGAVPTPLSPTATWRQAWPPNTLDWMRTTQGNAYAHLRPAFRTCRKALGLPVEDLAVPPPDQVLRGEDFKPISPPLSPR